MAYKPETLLHHFSLVLLGKSGVGKSATGNTILGREAFNSRKSSTSTTRNVQMENVIVEAIGRVSIDVYDTPGFFNTEMSNEDVIRKCQSLLPLDDSDPTVFLLVIPVSRFTPEDQSSAEEAQKILKPMYLQNTWILFTRGDTLEREGQSVEEFIKGTDNLKRVVQRFDNRYHVFNNKTQIPNQVRKLLDKIETSPLNMRRLMKMAWPQNNKAPSCNIILLGKSGVGKSATGNTILGQSHFISKRSSKSISQKTERRNVTIDGLNIEVYDTPGLYSTTVSNEDIIKEYQSLLLLPSYQTVPTVFLLVLRPERPTQEDRSTVLDIETLLGDHFFPNTWILFTRGDELESENLTIETFIEDTEELKAIIQRFKNRYHVFNNKIQNPDQVKRLMEQLQNAPLNIKCSLKMAWMKCDDQAEKNSFLHFNVILIGQTGAGVSATGNTILGKKAFESKMGCFSVTRVIQKERVVFDGVTLDVYDTPGLFNTEISSEDIMEKWQPLLQLDQSVPTVFLLVMTANRFTSEGKRTVELIEEMIPEWLLQNTWILFTHGDGLEMEGLTVEEFIEDIEELKRVIKRFKNRYHIFNNRTQNPDQVRRLMKKIKKSPLNMAPELRRSRMTPPGSEKDPLQRRIILLGKTGVGKSAAGNTILRENRFRSELNLHLVTTQCDIGQAEVAGRNVCVVDTPGLFDTEMSAEDLAVEIGRSIYLSSPGAHAFLYVWPINVRFTQQEEDVVQKLEMMFGEEMRKYIILLFTHGDQLEGVSVDELIKHNRALSRLVEQCGGRYHVFNNEDQRNREQVTELLEKIDRMVEQNGGNCYSNELFEDAARFRQKEEERIREEEENRKRREKEQMREEMERRKKEIIERIQKRERLKRLENERYKREREKREGSSNCCIS